MGRYKAQRGALLIELAVALAILTLVAVGTVSWLSHQAEKNKAERLAAAMQAVQQGVQSFLSTHALAFMNESDFVVSGIQDGRRPTLMELQQLGFLAPSFAQHPGIEVVLYKEGECPGTSCFLHALVYATQPLVNKKQQIDLQAIAHWQGVVQGAGLVVQPQQPGAFSGGHLVVDLQLLSLGFQPEVGSVALLASSSGMAEDTVVGRYLLLPHTERLGESCELIGAVSRDEAGQGLLVCEQYQWIQSSAPAESGSLEGFKEMIRTFWKIPIPEDSPGGAYVVVSDMFTHHCWVPNPMVIYSDGRGVCKCPPEYKARSMSVPAVKDNYMRAGISRPKLTMYYCA